MNKKIILSIVICFGYLFSSSQNLGFLGMKNQISIDIRDILQYKLTAEYKRTFSNNMGVWLMASQTIINNELSSFMEMDTVTNSENAGVYDGKKYGTVNGGGLDFGIGFLFNSKTTGMPLPMGHYFCLQYVVNQNQFTEIIDSTKARYSYIQKGSSYRLVIGREISITRNIAIDFYVTPGLSIGTVTSDNKSLRAPTDIYPASNGFSDPTFTGDTFEKKYARLYFQLGIKAGWLF